MPGVIEGCGGLVLAGRDGSGERRGELYGRWGFDAIEGGGADWWWGFVSSGSHSEPKVGRKEGDRLTDGGTPGDAP